MSNLAWYIVKQSTGECEIVESVQAVDALEEEQPRGELPKADDCSPKQWGPYESREVAIARRVGLIRAGKCKPL